MEDEPTCLVACCDIGGTKVALALVDAEGRVLARDRYLLGIEREPEQVLTRARERLHALAAGSELPWHDVAGVGCSVAGRLDPSRETVSSCTVGDWLHVPFRSLLQDAFGLPVWMEMDACAGALGEAWLGEGQGVADFIYVAVGTGIGAGIRLSGGMYHGWHGTAGEIGHTVIDPDGPRCYCGSHGCLEALASGPAIALRARQAIESGHQTMMPGLAANGEITAMTVFEAARAGDGVALDIVHETAQYLGIGLANLVNLLNPEVIALAGGVIEGGTDMLLDPVRMEVQSRCGHRPGLEGTRIVAATLGQDAPLVGVAYLVYQGLR